MVKCNEEGAPPGVEEKLAAEDIIVPHSSRKNSRASNSSSYGFRLQDQADDKLERETATSVSAYSTYKQRIDSMFDETRSQMSCYGVTGGSIGLEKIRPVLGFSDDDEEGKQQRINNTVQARIEKMFAEMAKSGNSNMKDISARKLSINSSPSPSQTPSINILHKVTSLQGLQEPLKDLYLSYRRAMETQQDRSAGELCLKGTLEINSSGLKVHHKGQDRGELEQLNPFPNDRCLGSRTEYAFLPLIADPDAIDKGALFKPLNTIEEKIILSRSQKGGIDTPYNHHSPMFAVVMRKMGVSKQLECHGFVCACSEDAIVIAANLYQALMNNMQNRNNVNGKPSTKQESVPKNQNGVNYVSLGGESSVTGEGNKSQSDNTSNISGRSSGKGKPVIVNDVSVPKENVNEKKRTTVAKIPPPVPVRPPRKNKKSSASSASDDGEELIVQNKFSDSVINSSPNKFPFKRVENGSQRSSNTLTQKTEETSLNTYQSTFIRGVRRTVSDRHNYGGIMLASDNPEGGDILTKVAIPRSRSFLNAGGPLTRYNRRQGSGVPYGEREDSGGTGSSPLGFNELFTEFKLQEGLNSMDDILDAIIDAEGMSFNDLKPIYKEFLMKLAVTLTKDELYQRSKSIMRRQKKKLGRRNSCYKRKKTFVASGGGLKRVFRRSVNKLKPTKSRFNNFEFTSVLFPSESIRSNKKASKKIMALESSSTSTSSYSTRTFKLHQQPSFNKTNPSNGGNRLQRKPSNSRRRSTVQREMNNRIMSTRPQLLTSTSEDSDFFSMVRCTNGMGPAATINSSRRGPNRSSSGYFSCSECSYDSESCTCISADKCYCSLGENKKHQQPILAKDLSLSSCGCDTDSCIESDKCYCAFSFHNKSNKSHHHSSHRHCVKAIIESHPNKMTQLRNARNDSVIEQLKRRGFVASESSLSRAASPTTAWRQNEKYLASNKKKDINTIKSSKSLEFLQINQPPNRKQYSSGWDTRRAEHGTNRRMDVYDILPKTQAYQHNHNDTQCNRPRSYSSDNLALDYDLFTTSSKSEDEEVTPLKPQRKVLVVSARDPRGRVIYMGASCRSDEGLRSKCNNVKKYNRNQKSGVGTPSAACEALSVKKSAEIAALFSDVKLSQTTDIVAKNAVNNENGEVFYNTLEPPDYFMTSKSRSNRSALGSNLENSLGYLP
ncbi:hypothetical protein L9F63_020054 [Diploptera punctata]|uniref:PID domain-containing protein n=1 Tax=Diploptera punctata TaxID=6984 RepID=A0AAD7ZTR5_DIPPU|nr:hypothetical protein L9F63_020054 [Diploptera punctata]